MQRGMGNFDLQRRFGVASLLRGAWASLAGLGALILLALLAAGCARVQPRPEKKTAVFPRVESLPPCIARPPECQESSVSEAPAAQPDFLSIEKAIEQVASTPAGYENGVLRVIYPGDHDHHGLKFAGKLHPLVLNEGAGKRFPVEKGVVSYYHQLRRTASGLLPDSRLLTAAHRTLPFGTIVRCTLLETGASVIVTITDRGPHIKGRVIDLSKTAAQQIHLPAIGIAQCVVEVLAYPLTEIEKRN